MADSTISVSFVENGKDNGKGDDRKDDERKGKEELEDQEGAAAPYIPSLLEGYDSLRRWEIIRHSKEVHEKTVTEEVFQNMVERVEAGKKVCDNLYRYFKELASAERSFTKDIFKVDSLRDILDKKQANGSLLATITAMEKQNMATCSIYEEHVSSLSDEIISKTNSLQSDYANQTYQVVSNAKKLSKDIEQYREDVVKNFSNYCSAFDDQQSAERRGVAAEKDAWMEEQKYHQSVIVLRAELAKYSASMGSLFERFLALEERRIETTKLILQQHTNKQKLMLSKLTERANEVAQMEVTIDPVADKQALVADKFNRSEISARVPLVTTMPPVFSSSSSSSSTTSTTSTTSTQPVVVVVPEEKKRRRASSLKSLVKGSSASTSGSQLNTSQYMISNSDAPAPVSAGTQQIMQLDVANWNPDRPPLHLTPEKTGLLWRQSSIVKSWKKNYFLLTKGGFLHIYNSEDDKTPDYSVSLGQVQLQHLSNYDEENVMELWVKPGSFFGSAKYLFKADSRPQMEQWLNAMKKFVPLPKKTLYKSTGVAAG